MDAVLAGTAAILLGLADLLRAQASMPRLRLSAVMAVAGLVIALALGLWDWRAIVETPLVLIAAMGLAQAGLAWTDLRAARGLPPPPWL